MIIDDEFVLLGSANVNQKSMTHDSELDVGIVDADGMFAKDLRKALWAEHLSTDLKAVILTVEELPNSTAAAGE